MWCSYGLKIFHSVSLDFAGCFTHFQSCHVPDHFRGTRSFLIFEPFNTDL